jgi:hypothetical protein
MQQYVRGDSVSDHFPEDGSLPKIHRQGGDEIVPEHLPGALHSLEPALNHYGYFV